MAFNESTSDDYRRDLHRLTIVDHEETVRLWEAMNAGDPDAKNRLVENVLPWTFRLASKAKGRFPLCDFEDLVQAASIGVIRAVEKWEPDKGRLVTYATWWANQAIGRFAEENHTVRAPQHTVQAMHRCLKVLQNAGRPFTSAGLAEAARQQGERPEIMLAAYHAQRTYKQTDLVAMGEANDRRNNDLFAMIEADGEEIAEALDARDDAELCERLLSFIRDDRRRSIVRRRYLADETLADIGRDLGISRERVRQLENDAFRDMRRAVNFGCFVRS